MSGSSPWMSLSLRGTRSWSGSSWSGNVAPGAMSERMASDQLLAAVDVIRRAGDRRVFHEVDGEGGDILRSDDPADRQRGGQLVAARGELVAEQPRRQGRVHEARGDDVDPHRGQLDGQVARERLQGGAHGA